MLLRKDKKDQFEEVTWPYLESQPQKKELKSSFFGYYLY